MKLQSLTKAITLSLSLLFAGCYLGAAAPRETITSGGGGTEVSAVARPVPLDANVKNIVYMFIAG